MGNRYGMDTSIQFNRFSVVLLVFADEDLHGDVDGADLSGDDRSMASDQDFADTKVGIECLDTDREALNLVRQFFVSYFLLYVPSL